MTDNPVLVSLLRGDAPEAWYRGAYCVLEDGRLVDSAGPPDQVLCLRSAAKPFQTLAHLTSGAADRFHVPDEALALMTASHGGEDVHVKEARSLLALGGLDESHLQCGAHAPLHRASAERLRANGLAATALHNNCSGKHAGMLLASLAGSHGLLDYLDPSHPHQRAILQLLARLAEIDPSAIRIAIDGCSAPTFSLPLESAARAWSALGALERDSMGPDGDATRRLLSALRKHPHLFAGTQRFDTDLILATEGHVLAKIGAQGFYGAVVPTRRLGIALHIDDGDWNMSERVLAALLTRHGALEPDEHPTLQRYLDPTRRNYAGRDVGSVRIEL